MKITHMIEGYVVKEVEFKDRFINLSLIDQRLGDVSLNLTRAKFLSRIGRLVKRNHHFIESVVVSNNKIQMIFNCGDNCLTIEGQ